MTTQEALTQPTPVHRPASPQVFAAGVVLSLLLAVVFYKQGEAQDRRDFEVNAAILARSVRRSFALPLEALRAVSAFQKIHTTVSPQDFEIFASSLMANHPSLAALEWAELVEDNQREAFEAAQTARTGRNFRIREPIDNQMKPAQRRPRYAPLVYLHPFLLDLEGLDVTFEPVRRTAIEGTLSRKQMTATSKFRLVEDPPEVYSVAVYDPIQRPGATPISGLSIALFRLDPLLRQALNGTDLSVLDFALIDEDASEADRLLFASRPGAEKTHDVRFSVRQEMAFVERRWTAIFATRARNPRWSHWLVGLGGLLASAFAAIAVAQVQSRKKLEEALKRERELGGYQLLHKLGEGGMGEVFEGAHRILRRKVAIKLIRHETFSKELTERFHREARTLSELSHPHTITLYDYGSTQEGRFYLVMEYLDGVTFEQLIDTHGAQPPERVRRLLLQVCEALAEAHAKGVIHRDIKPANLMVCRVGGMHDFVKVLDFGLAKLNQPGESKLSLPGAIVGTVTYLAPECLTNPDNASPRSDIYALGCVAYELLAGHPVFPSTDSTAQMTAHLVQPPPPLDEARMGAEFAGVILRCLEKDPGARYQSTLQLARALEHLALPPWTELDAAEWWEAHKQSPDVPPEEPAVEPISFRPAALSQRKHRRTRPPETR